jgi:hypothetical protein
MAVIQTVHMFGVMSSCVKIINAGSHNLTFNALCRAATADTIAGAIARTRDVAKLQRI